MTRVLQSLVWIAVLIASGPRQRSYSYLKNSHSITLLSFSFLGLFEALGAIDTEDTFVPEISEECKELGYCERIPNYPIERAREQIKELGDDLKAVFTTDQLDDDVQIEKRIDDRDIKFIGIPLCNLTNRVLIPDSLQDKNNAWWTVLQDRENNLTQKFNFEYCNQRDGPCTDFPTFPKTYTGKCLQKHLFRPVIIVRPNVFQNLSLVSMKRLKIPSCCACTASPKIST